MNHPHHTFLRTIGHLDSQGPFRFLYIDVRDLASRLISIF